MTEKPNFIIKNKSPSKS